MPINSTIQAYVKAKVQQSLEQDDDQNRLDDHIQLALQFETVSHLIKHTEQRLDEQDNKVVYDDEMVQYLNQVLSAMRGLREYTINELADAAWQEGYRLTDKDDYRERR